MTTPPPLPPTSGSVRSASGRAVVGAAVVTAVTVGFGVGGATDEGFAVCFAVGAGVTGLKVVGNDDTGAVVVGGGNVGGGVTGTGVGSALVTQTPGATSTRFGLAGVTMIVPVPPSSNRSAPSSLLSLSFLSFFLPAVPNGDE